MAMGSPLGPLLANVFMSSTEESERVNSHVDDTLTIMPNIETASSWTRLTRHIPR